MLAISPKLTLIAFLPLPVASIVIQYFGRRIHERFERIQAMFSDISARAQENFSGARVIRAYVQEQAEIAAFENANQEYIRRSLGLVRLMGMLWPTLELMLGARCSHRAVGRRTPGSPRPHEHRRLRSLQHLHGPANLAGNRPRMGHQHLPARHSIANPDQRNSPSQARHRRRTSSRGSRAASHERPADYQELSKLRSKRKARLLETRNSRLEAQLSPAKSNSQI